MDDPSYVGLEWQMATQRVAKAARLAAWQLPIKNSYVCERLLPNGRGKDVASQAENLA